MNYDFSYVQLLVIFFFFFFFGAKGVVFVLGDRTSLCDLPCHIVWIDLMFCIIVKSVTSTFLPKVVGTAEWSLVPDYMVINNAVRLLTTEI